MTEPRLKAPTASKDSLNAKQKAVASYRQLTIFFKGCLTAIGNRRPFPFARRSSGDRVIHEQNQTKRGLHERSNGPKAPLGELNIRDLAECSKAAVYF